MKEITSSACICGCDPAHVEVGEQGVAVLEV